VKLLTAVLVILALLGIGFIVSAFLYGTYLDDCCMEPEQRGDSFRALVRT